ncbi:hypothetical protein Dsin_013492 [Dipteronia sinensis]|uniref:Small-subunit processome Utp12 domain-containing protein n=1 Tax=Dipteronia sinensis TaxID=43782 RepID=A0AAE0AL81_9ROSI|nr:hypothetical protein Dsin_013492 [Dipteronia sinensis]
MVIETVGCFFGVDKRTDRVNKIYTITRDCRIFSWGYSGSDGKLDEISGEDEGKKKKDFDGKGVDSGEEKWYLHRQFVSLAVDHSGEVICAGTLDSFEIFVWSMKTGRLLDILSGHEGPVHGLAFSLTNGEDAALNEDQPSRALILSLRLNEDSLIKKCIFAVGPVDIPAVASSIPHRYMQRLIEALAELLESCPHLEFIRCWCQNSTEFQKSASFTKILAKGYYQNTSGFGRYMFFQ